MRFVVQNNLKVWFIIAAMAAVISCVTVHVNFPEGAVQRATDDYVQELYKAKTKDDAASKKKSKTGSFLLNIDLIPKAHAQKTVGQFAISSPKAKSIQAKQAARIEQIGKFKKAGFLGEASNGMLVLRNAKKLKDHRLKAKKIKKLLAAENKDREALYKEVARSNSAAPDQMSLIKASFGRSFQAASPRGTWIEKNGSWRRK